MTTCGTFWGSHECDLPAGHDPEQKHPIHECVVHFYGENGSRKKIVCSQAQYLAKHRIRSRFTLTDTEWTDWEVAPLRLSRNDKEKAR